MGTLYNLSQEYEQLYELLSDDNDEMLNEALFDTIEGIEGEFEQKAEATAVYIKRLNAEAEMIKQEVQTLQKRQKSRQNKADRLKEYLFDAMKSVKLNKIDAPKASISLRKSPPALIIHDEEKFIEWAQNNMEELLNYQKPSIAKTSVKMLINSGEQLPYCEIEQKECISIK